MSDNVSKWKGKPKKRLSWKLPVLLLLLLVVAGGLIWYLYFRDDTKPFFPLKLQKEEKVREAKLSDPDAPAFSFDADSDNRYGYGADHLIVASGTGLSVYASDGEPVHQLNGKLETPSLSVSDSVAVAFDAGGMHLYAQSLQSSHHLDLAAEQPILDADAADDGHFVFLGNETGYHSVLYVYDAKMNPTYTWWSASQYFSACAISPNGKYVAASCLGQRDGIFCSGLVLFDTASEEPLSETELGSGLVYDLHFVKDNMICAVCEDRVVFVKTDGTVAGSYDFQGAKLKDFAFGKDGFLTLLVNMYHSGTSYELVTVDFSGKKLSSKAVHSQVFSLSAFGEYVAVLMPDAMAVFDSALSVFAKAYNELDATDVILTEARSAILLSGGSGYVYRF